MRNLWLIREWLSNLKVRASWGKNGNDNIAEFGYTSLTAMGNNVLLGKDAIKWNGSKAQRLANPDLKWEESEQTDLGIDLGFFNNALTFSADYYIKKTNGMIITMPIPSYVGETKPLGNVGDMENSGFEFELGYKWNIADAKFAVKGNATYLKNELKNLGNDTGYMDLDGIQGFSGGGTRGSNGQPFPYFYGYKTDGVFQNMDEVRAYVNKDGKMIMPDAVPGDTRFVDVNGDGSISADDRTNIGNGTPDWTYGLNLNADWKGFDFNIFFQGVAGAALIVQMLLLVTILLGCWDVGLVKVLLISILVWLSVMQRTGWYLIFMFVMVHIFVLRILLWDIHCLRLLLANLLLNVCVCMCKLKIL